MEFVFIAVSKLELFHTFFLSLYRIQNSPKSEAVWPAVFSHFTRRRAREASPRFISHEQRLAFECSLDMMAGLSPSAQDRLFFLGLGLTACTVIGIMRRMLIHYRNSSAIPQSESKPQYITQEVEDSLKISTLNKLLDSPNYSIQETTAVIICERALHDASTVDALLYQLTRPDHDLREQAIRALTMMMNSCKHAS